MHKFTVYEKLPPDEECGLSVSPRHSLLRTAVVLSPEHYRQLSGVFNLCVELDVELDGVALPGTAASIANAIRRLVEQ